MAIIAVEGMKFNAFIGRYPGEQVLGNEIEVSVKLAVPSEDVETTDEIRNTIDYEEIYWLVNEVMQQRMNLLETAVKKIIERISSQYPLAKKIKVRVSKLQPPIRGRIKKVWVEDGWVRES